ncbi:hypothetical protein KCU71_g13233, partial [Aureobasidium melanogenum]
MSQRLDTTFSKTEPVVWIEETESEDYSVPRGCMDWKKDDSPFAKQQVIEDAKRTAAGIPTWSPTVVLICRSTAYVWQSGRDAQFSAD